MKIIHIVSHFHPRLGGVEKHVLNVAKEQVKSGNSVTIITGQYENYSAYENINGIEVYRFPATRSSLRMKLWHIKHFLLFLQADILHVHNIMSVSNIPAFLLKKQKTVLTLHGWGGVYPIPTDEKKLVQTSIKKIANKTVTVGRFVNKWYEIESDEVIYGAVEPLNKNDDIKKDYDICILGRLESDAGIKLIIDALANVSLNLDAKFKICVCGDGALKGYLLEKLKGIKVDFKGFVSNPEIYIKSSKSCITSGYLGILECLSLQTKVFSIYDNPLKEDYLRLSPFEQEIFISKDEEELTQNINQFIQSSPSTIEAIPEYLEQFTWQKLVQTYNHLYQSITNDNL